VQADHIIFQVRAGANPNALITSGNKLSTICDRHMPGVIEFNAADGTPLHHAILHNDLDTVNILISHGADCMIEDSEHISALLLSACLHCSEILERLLDVSKVDVSKVDVKTWYDYYGNYLVYSVLDGKWDDLRMAVHTTAFYNQAERTLSLLHASGVNWDDLCVGWNLPALHFAALRSHVNIMALLLKMGLKYQIDMPSSVAFPLHTAIQSGDEYKLILLLDYGASANLKIAGSGESCLHLCVRIAFQDTFFLETLLKYGAEVDAQSNRGETPYCTAVARKHFEAADLLLKMGASPNVVDYKAGLFSLSHVFRFPLTQCVEYNRPWNRPHILR
jgi:ankyrin repeat protein